MEERRGHYRARTILGLLGAFTPLVIFSFLTALSALSAYREVDQTRLRATAGALAAAADAQLASYVVALQTLSDSPLFDGALNSEEIEKRARVAGERLGGWIVLLDGPPEYQMLANTLREPGTPLPTALPNEREAALLPIYESAVSAGRPAVTDLFPGRIAQRAVLAVVVPVDRPGRPRLALALGFQPEVFHALLARQTMPASTFAAIHDGAFRILTHSSDPDGRLTGMAAPDWLKTALEGKQSHLAVGPDRNGRDRVFALERLTQAPGWFVVVSAPVESENILARIPITWALSGAGTIAFAFGMVAWFGRREAIRDAREEAAALRAGRAEVERLHNGLPAIIFLYEFAVGGLTRPLYRSGDIPMVVGWPRAELEKPEILQSLIQSATTELVRELPKLLRNGQISFEWRVPQKDGGWRTLHSMVRVLTRHPDGSGELVGYTLDISARKEAEERAIASARLASLGEMSAGIAHELKQPLAVILLAVENARYALDHADVPQVEKRLQRIATQAEKAADLIDRLRRFAHGGMYGVKPAAVSLVQAVQEALDVVQSALRHASIGVDIALGDPSPVVLGQRVFLEQVLCNLFLNARDAMIARPPHLPRKIGIAATRTGNGMVQLIVADTGGGIVLEVMNRLFEPFVTTKRPDRGTGLGLSLCHGLIEGMGGSISARNTAEGAVFTILLPAAGDDSSADT
jgi:C4-dicarboxylate-specific signal transduction histidine kinase